MQCFRLPQGTSDQLNRIHHNFFWKTSSSVKGLPLIAWDTICKPKSKGGLGLRKSEAVNLAFQCKLAWRIMMKESSLWIQAMHDKYLGKAPFFEYICKGSDSMVWRSVLRCRHLLWKGLRWKVGKGDRILFWLDNWLENRSLLEILNLRMDDISHPYATLSEFITLQKRWDLQKITQMIPNRNIIQQICGIDIPSSNIEDSLSWGLQSSGVFMTKSATWLAHSTNPLRDMDWAHKWI